MIACEVDNGEDIFFIMRGHKARFLQDKARCRTSLTPRSEVLLFFSYRIDLEDLCDYYKEERHASRKRGVGGGEDCRIEAKDI